MVYLTLICLLRSKCVFFKTILALTMWIMMYICHVFGRAWVSQVVKLGGGEARLPKEITMQALPATHNLMDHRIRRKIGHMMSFVPESRQTCEI